MFVLDTNHASELIFRTPAGLRLLRRLDQSGGDAAVTAVTVEESLRGWLAEIRRQEEPRRQIPAYQRLIAQVEVFASWLVLPWDDDAANRFDGLKILAPESRHPGFENRLHLPRPRSDPAHAQRCRLHARAGIARRKLARLTNRPRFFSSFGSRRAADAGRVKQMRFRCQSAGLTGLQPHGAAGLKAM